MPSQRAPGMRWRPIPTTTAPICVGDSPCPPARTVTVGCGNLASLSAVLLHYSFQRFAQAGIVDPANAYHIARLHTLDVYG